MRKKAEKKVNIAILTGTRRRRRRGMGRRYPSGRMTTTPIKSLGKRL